MHQYFCEQVRSPNKTIFLACANWADISSSTHTLLSGWRNFWCLRNCNTWLRKSLKDHVNFSLRALNILTVVDESQAGRKASVALAHSAYLISARNFCPTKWTGHHKRSAQSSDSALIVTVSVLAVSLSEHMAHLGFASLKSSNFWRASVFTR